MSKLLRLFVGIFPSPSTQEQLYKKATNLSQSLQTQVRLLAPKALHLTVKFIGNVDETQLSDLTKTFLKARGNLPSASLQIRQFILFPSRRQPRVLAAEIERSSELGYIFQFFNRGFSDLGIAVDQRSFHPHITVARARRWQQEKIDPAILQLVEPITSVAFVSSQLTSDGAKYTVVSSVRLN
ncbi:RNA 2',3'-cyclic phosphodiesterase [Pleurocapsa sp. PCC 7319]|uniref:RNA 2',3'-cyclic phosphodiesterase n=1 Tax=Pleurocapsa sp. PCC 7319 TaxID=118161 RepID=UPI0003480E32|nr:RNA 2',3'-cyclic phosphodiesterase [Pleurocapsa sp. PCC 7319]